MLGWLGGEAVGRSGWGGLMGVGGLAGHPALDWGGRGQSGSGPARGRGSRRLVSVGIIVTGCSGCYGNLAAGYLYIELILLQETTLC